MNIATEKNREIDPFNDDEKYLHRLDPAWGNAALYFRTGQHFGHGEHEERCQSLQSIYEQLESRRKRYEKNVTGESMELLHAIALCAKENLPLPTWLALAYTEHFSQLGKTGGSTSLDQVFKSKNLPTKTPNKAADDQQDWLLGGNLWKAVWKVADSHNGLDTAIDAVLKTRKWGVNKTKAKALVLMIDETQKELINSQSLSRFWEIRRKQVQKKT